MGAKNFAISNSASTPADARLGYSYQVAALAMPEAFCVWQRSNCNVAPSCFCIPFETFQNESTMNRGFRAALQIQSSRVFSIAYTSYECPSAAASLTADGGEYGESVAEKKSGPRS